MANCEDCGDDVKRRTRCPNCGFLLCRWCYHHAHNLQDGVVACDPEPEDEAVLWRQAWSDYVEDMV